MLKTPATIEFRGVAGPDDLNRAQAQAAHGHLNGDDVRVVRPVGHLQIIQRERGYGIARYDETASRGTLIGSQTIHEDVIISRGALSTTVAVSGSSARSLGLATMSLGTAVRNEIVYSFRKSIAFGVLNQSIDPTISSSEPVRAWVAVLPLISAVVVVKAFSPVTVRTTSLVWDSATPVVGLIAIWPVAQLVASMPSAITSWSVSSVS